MKLRVRTTGQIEPLCWDVAKGFFFLVLVVTAINASLPAGSFSGPAGARTLLPGIIRPYKSVVLSVDFPARVVRVACQEGAVVRTGDLIAELESPEVESQLESAERRLRMAELRASLASGGNASEYETEQAAATNRMVESIRRRLATFTTAEQEETHARAKARSARVSALAARQLATAEEVDAARRAEQYELRTLEAAQATVARLAEDLEAALSQQKLVRLGATGKDPRVQRINELELEQARRDFELANARKAQLRVVAPAGGAILGGLVRAEDQTAPGQILAHIGDITRFEVEIQVAAAIAKTLRPGLPMSVRLPTDPPLTVAGTVKNSIPAADVRYGGYVVRIDVPNPGSFRDLVGMEVTVDIPHEKSSW